MFQLVSAAFVVVALIAGAPVTARLPLAALAAVAVAVVSATGLVDIGGFLRIWRTWRAEGLIALVAAAGVVGLGALWGLLISVALALWELGRRAARPHDAVLAFAQPDEPPREVGDQDAHHPDVLIYRVDAPLFFANADRVRERVLGLALDRGPELRWVILDAGAFFHLDATAASALTRLTVDLRARGCQLVVARARPAILATLRSNPYQDGATQRVPAFSTVRAAFLATHQAEHH